MAPEMALPEEETLEAEDVGPLWAVLLQWAGVPHMAPHHTLGDHLWDFRPQSEVPHHQFIAALLWVCLLQDLRQWCMGHQFSVHLLGFLQQDHHPSLGLMSTQPSSPLAPLWLCPSMRCPMASPSPSLRRL